MNSWQALRRALDRLTLYLPMLVMALLAMGSWWLVRSMPDLWGAATVKPVRKEPDYHIERFSTEVFDAQGRRIRQISGDKARHYPHTDELHIDAMRFHAVNEEGVQMTGVARQGIVAQDGDRVTLLGQAQVVRMASAQAPRTELRGERLVALQKAQKLLSDDPVDIWRDRDHFVAQNLDFDVKTGQYGLGGRVRATLQPQDATR
jgi:lipopolysaccharide export system protein LptC